MGFETHSACSSHLTTLLMQIKIAAVEMQIGDISGFNLSALNHYYWHPGFARTRLSR